MESQSSILLRRLNHYCAKALEGAASLCQTRAHAEITPEHWLLKLLEQGQGDLTVLARRYEWDMDAVWQSLLSWLDAQPRSVRSRPELSAALQSLLKQAWLAATLAGDEQIRSVHLLTAMVETSGLTHCEGIWPLMTLTASQLEKLRPLLEVQSDERHDIASSSTVSNVTVIGRAAPLQGEMPKTENPGAVQGDTVLNRFTVNVTARASEGKIDPVFGRDNEIRQMVDILSRRRKNNPILVGEPGVGKTALVEGLALRIAEGNVPESLRPVIVRTLDLGLLQAGAGVKGEFEQRLKNIIDAVQHSPVPVLLFIDEAHTIIGAGNQAGGADAANLLKPALARGELRTIAATTWSEYKQYFERDAALERRFQMVKVDEPDDDTACLMLRGLKSRYAEHHDDSEHPDPVTSDNHTRNVWRTPANNKLRMEDKRQEEHIKLATEYGKTQLNMGHLVNGQREKRGAGFELRTDEFGAVRAAKGLFLTADAQAKAQGPVLEMAPALNQMNQANSQMQALNSAAEAAGALVCDINTRMSLVTDKIRDLQSAVLLGSAPQGVALTSGEHLQLSSTRNTMINAGQHLDIGAMKNLSVSVEKALGMFVHKEGAKLIASQGDIDIQAQHNTMALFSEKQLTVTSSEDEIIISTPETLTLNGGGSYLRLSKNGIEHGSTGEFIMKTSDYLVPGTGANLPNETPNFSLTDITQENKISSKSFND